MIRLARRIQRRSFIEIPQSLLDIIGQYTLEERQELAINFIANSGLNWQQLNDEEQLHAYEAYAIHGPPGTGKTFVIALGSIRYLARTDDEEDKKQIVILTQTNAAADRVVETFNQIFENANLSNLLKRQLLLRVYSRRFNINTLDENLRQYCTIANYDNNPVSRDRLQFHRSSRIIVSTVYQPRSFQRSSLFASGQVIVDESSQLNPPLITMGYYPLNPSILGLVGDPNQLPPIYTLELLMTDTMSYFLGRNRNFRRRLPRRKYVMLNVQYRMNPVISGLVNTLAEFLHLQQDQIRNANETESRVLGNFYEDKNVFSDNSVLVEIFDSDYPVVLIDTSELSISEEIQVLGGSLFNASEAKLASLLFYLFTIKYPGIENDTAIIAPYKEQARIIRQEVHEAPVDTVDKFQGREKDLVIISMVRKNIENQIGFLSEINRLNVSLSRARCKLVIIIDVNTFRDSQEYFNEVITYCENTDNTCYINMNDENYNRIEEMFNNLRE